MVAENDVLSNDDPHEEIQNDDLDMEGINDNNT
jgi:hypothetical protein